MQNKTIRVADNSSDKVCYPDMWYMVLRLSWLEARVDLAELKFLLAS
jgi:hypothetical protein